MCTQGVDVEPQRSIEESRILHDHRNGVSQLFEAECAYIHSVDEDAAFKGLQYAQESQRYRGLASTCTSNDSYLLLRFD